MPGTDEIRRRLAAILTADAVGYSRLMAADDLAALASLDAGREIFRTRIDAHQGRVIDMAGDSILAVFETAIGAMSAAIEVQRTFANASDPAPDATRMRFRIGVHLGDIIEKHDGTVYGDGVNIASRLQELAEPGGVTVSEAIYDSVRDRISANFQDHGAHRVKNIARPVHTYRVAIDAERRAPQAPTADDGSRKSSIAVLPFDNMSGDPAQEYFADGITEDIITALSKNRWLRVIARNSTFAYKSKSVDIRRIAQELDARFVLEGSFRKSGDRIRVTAQLIDGASGGHIWAEHYDRKLEDIFEVQDEVTRTIAARIEPELGAVERERVARKPTENLDAWDCYHLGLSHMYKFDRDSNREAQRLFRRAIGFDPNFAVAHARLSYCAVLDMVYFDAAPTEAALDQALTLARRATALDDKDWFAHLAVGRAFLGRREYAQALAECETAIELNPTSAQAFCAAGDALAYSGRLEAAIERFDQAIRLSPLDPWRWAFFSYSALAHLFLGEYAKAAELARAALRVPNCQYWANAHLTAALGHLGLEQESRAALAALLQRKPEFSCHYAEEHLFYLQSREQLETYLEGLKKGGVPD